MISEITTPHEFVNQVSIWLIMESILKVDYKRVNYWWKQIELLFYTLHRSHLVKFGFVHDFHCIHMFMHVSHSVFVILIMFFDNLNLIILHLFNFKKSHFLFSNFVYVIISYFFLDPFASSFLNKPYNSMRSNTNNFHGLKMASVYIVWQQPSVELLEMLIHLRIKRL